MKSNLPALLLLAACVCLGIVLWKQNQMCRDQTQHRDRTINFYSNRVAVLQVKLSHAAAGNAALSNHLGVVETTLSTTSARLQKAEEEFRLLENRKIDLEEECRDLNDELGKVVVQFAQLSRSRK